MICFERVPVRMTRAAARAGVEALPACGHLFHVDCVRALQRRGVNNLCPLCRAAMPDSATTMVDDAHTLHVRAEFGKVDAATYRTLKEASTEKLFAAVARDPDHAKAQLDLGRRLREAGRYAEAGPFLRRALALDKAAAGGGTPGPVVATDLNDLASLLHDQGKYDEAGPLFAEAYAITLQTMGEDHPARRDFVQNTISDRTR